MELLTPCFRGLHGVPWVGVIIHHQSRPQLTNTFRLFPVPCFHTHPAVNTLHSYGCYDFRISCWEMSHWVKGCMYSEGWLCQSLYQWCEISFVVSNVLYLPRDGMDFKKRESQGSWFGKSQRETQNSCGFIEVTINPLRLPVSVEFCCHFFFSNDVIFRSHVYITPWIKRASS